MSQTPQKSRQDWIDGALLMIADHGVNKLAVEPLAKRLKTTKGSFYWHFTSKNELVTAVLEYWQRRGVAEPIQDANNGTPQDKLRHILELSLRPGSYDRAEWKLLTSDDPQVQAVAQKIHASRIDYLAEQVTLLGVAAQTAHVRAKTAYAAYLGQLTLMNCTSAKPDAVRPDAAASHLAEPQLAQPDLTATPHTSIVDTLLQMLTTPD